MSIPKEIPLQYLVLFVSAFGAATILPGSSEAVLLALLTVPGNPSPLLLWIVATAGNTLGAAVNWILGHYVNHLEHKPWFPFTETQRTRAQSWFQRYGIWRLLFSWLPAIGDLIKLEDRKAKRTELKTYLHAMLNFNVGAYSEYTGTMN